MQTIPSPITLPATEENSQGKRAEKKTVKSRKKSPRTKRAPHSASPHGTTRDWLSREKRKTLLDRLLGEFLFLHKEAMESVKGEVVDPIQRVEALTKLSQALDRTLNALVKATPHTPHLTVAEDVLKHQVTFVESHYPQHATALLTILEPFGRELIKIFEE
ncbi:MAG: DUF1804 family protein [Magnetococcales bacterium]|nr:DUF1804 family protein [Magnetococcales bacterium]